MKLLLPFVVAASWALSCLGAQRPARPYTNSEIAGSRPEVWLFMGEGGDVNVFVETVSGPPGLDAEFQCSIPVVGCVVILEDLSVMVGGHDGSGSGVLEYWVLDGSSYSLSSRRVDPGADYVSITLDRHETELFVLDAGGDRIRSSSWGKGGLEAVSWSQMAGVADVPDLAVAEEFRRILYGGKVGEVTTILFGLMGMGTQGSWWSIAKDAGSGSLTIGSTNILRGPPLPTQAVRACSSTASEGGFTLGASGPPGAVVEAVDVTTGGILGAATLDAAGEATIPLSAALQIDHVYTVREPGQPVLEGSSFLCVRRYGEPETLSNGTKIGRHQAPFNIAIGEVGRYSVPLKRAVFPKANEHYRGVMTFDIRRNGVDAVLPYGQNRFVLESTVYVDASGFFSTVGTGSIGANLPIPNDPSLRGTVLLTQFLISDGPAVKVSEVLGVAIR